MARDAAYGVLVFGLAQGIFALMRTMGLMPPAGEGVLLQVMGHFQPLAGAVVSTGVGFVALERIDAEQMLKKSR